MESEHDEWPRLGTKSVSGAKLLQTLEGLALNRLHQQVSCSRVKYDIGRAAAR